MDVLTKTWPKLMIVLLVMMLSQTSNLAYAEEPNPGDEMIMVRKGLLAEATARIDATDRELVIVTGQRDSLRVDLWQCNATKPAKRSVFDSFEVGVLAGAAVVVLTIFVLDAQLE